jgi:hypothetical protein
LHCLTVLAVCQLFEIGSKHCPIYPLKFPNISSLIGFLSKDLLSAQDSKITFFGIWRCRTMPNDQFSFTSCEISMDRKPMKCSIFQPIQLFDRFPLNRPIPRPRHQNTKMHLSPTHSKTGSFFNLNPKKNLLFQTHRGYLTIHANLACCKSMESANELPEQGSEENRLSEGATKECPLKSVTIWGLF